jgi:hypothetical protein
MVENWGTAPRPLAQVVVSHQDHHPCEECCLISSRYNKTSLAIFYEKRHIARICRHHGVPASHGLYRNAMAHFARQRSLSSYDAASLYQRRGASAYLHSYLIRTGQGHDYCRRKALIARPET